MAPIDPEYLLSEPDETVMSDLAARGRSASKAVGEVMLRLIKLLDEEGYATVKATGIPPAFQGRYYTHAQAMAALSEPRRIIAANWNMVNMSLCAGFGQSCFNQQKNLDLWIEAAAAIAPPALAARLVPYLQRVQKAIRHFEQTEKWPTPEELGPTIDFGNIEEDVTGRGADWWTWSAQYIMLHKTSFFIRCADAAKP